MVNSPFAAANSLCNSLRPETHLTIDQKDDPFLVKFFASSFWSPHCRVNNHILWLEMIRATIFNRESQHDAIFKDNHHWNRQPMIWTYMDYSDYILIIPHILIQWVLELVTWKPHWIITRNRLHLSGGVPEYVLGTMVDWCWNTWDKNSPKRTTFCEIGIHIFTNPKAGIFRSHRSKVGLSGASGSPNWMQEATELGGPQY
jgi:hypothetical protein